MHDIDGGRARMSYLGQNNHIICLSCGEVFLVEELSESSEIECPQCNAIIEIQTIECNPEYYGELKEVDDHA
jgi:hypothetical protein